MILAMHHGVFGYEAMGLKRFLTNFTFGVYIYEASPFGASGDAVLDRGVEFRGTGLYTRNHRCQFGDSIRAWQPCAIW